MGIFGDQRRWFRSVHQNLTDDNYGNTNEAITRADGITTVDVLHDPDTIIWEETDGGGREVKQKHVYTEEDTPRFDLGEIVTTADGFTWKVLEEKIDYFAGQIIGYDYLLERLFGG